MSDLLLIRADATTQMGTGHVMRCLALAQAWRASGGEATFLQSSESAALANRLAAESFQVVRQSALPGSCDDGVHTSAQARALGAQWIVLDGYHFGIPMHEAIRQAGHRLLQVDDMGAGDRYIANVILNQNCHASEALYCNRTRDTELLLGTQYTLLRQEFLARQTSARSIPAKARKVLVTLGGSDPDNATLKVVRALRQLNTRIEAKVLVGPANPYHGELQRALDPTSSIELVTSTVAMPTFMEWADIAISGGGSTCWELAFMGLPSLILVLADNQAGVAHDMHRHGAAINLGCYAAVHHGDIAEALGNLLDSHQKRSDMAAQGRQLVDGRGAQRVVRFLREGKR